MKRYWILITTLVLLVRLSSGQAEFEVKLTPNSAIPMVGVYSNHESKIKYDRSRSETVDYSVEVRGRCPTPGSRLVQFQLRIDNQSVLTIPVSGNNRSLTGNNGNQWEEHMISVSIPAENEALIAACNSTALNLLQEQSHDEVFNANFHTASINSGKQVETYYDCFGGLGFSDYHGDRAYLPLRAFCEATGYRSQLRVTDSQLSLQPISRSNGTCELNIKGNFQTSYELYALRTKKSTVPLRYRFKYQNGDSDTHTEYSQWWEKTANPINAGAFIFNYTDRLPSSISSGRITLQVETNGNIQSAAQKSFNIDCHDAPPLTQPQTLELQLDVVSDTSETIALGNQICPTHALITSQIEAGYPIQGNMIILGSSLADLYVTSIDLDPGQSANLQRRVKLNWNSSGTTLSANQTTQSNALKKQSLNYGLRITNSDSTVVKYLPKKPYEIGCEYPSVNPGLTGNSTLGMSPDHTGGGGAPTAFRGNSPFSRSNNDRKVVDVGLRSDGELVQARKPLNLLKHELGHTQQQGRIINDADLNESANSRSLKPNTVPIPYPNVAATPEKSTDSKKWPGAWKLNSIQGKGNDRKQTDSHDRLANQETGHQSKPQPYTIPLQNATVSPIRSNQMSSHRTILFKGKTGQSCTPTTFPDNAVIKQAGRQRVVECVGGKISINRSKKVSHPWKPGDPVFNGNDNRKGPKKEIRSNSFGDEMPDDLPAG